MQTKIEKIHDYERKSFVFEPEEQLNQIKVFKQHMLSMVKILLEMKANLFDKHKEKRKSNFVSLLLAN